MQTKTRTEQLAERGKLANDAPLYYVPKHHPQGLHAVPASRIIQDQKAVRFIPALQSFLECRGCFLAPRGFDDFQLYKKVDLELPRIPEVSHTKWRDCVRASPPVSAAGRNLGEPAHLDFALVRSGEVNDHTDETCLKGEPTVLSAKCWLRLTDLR